MEKRGMFPPRSLGTRRHACQSNPFTLAVAQFSWRKLVVKGEHLFADLFGRFFLDKVLRALQDARTVIGK
jgi:hypothetical protein